MNREQIEKPLVIRCNEDGKWEKYEPYATIECPTEEDYEFLVRAVEEYKKKQSEGGSGNSAKAGVCISAPSATMRHTHARLTS